MLSGGRADCLSLKAIRLDMLRSDQRTILHTRHTLPRSATLRDFGKYPKLGILIDVEPFSMKIQMIRKISNLMVRGPFLDIFGKCPKRVPELSNCLFFGPFEFSSKRVRKPSKSLLPWFSKISSCSGTGPM